MQIKDAKELLKKQIEGMASEEEKELLDSWYYNWRREEPTTLTEEDFEMTRLTVFSKLPGPAQVSKRLKIWPRVAAAASIAIVISAGLYFFNPFRWLDRSEATRNLLANDIAPGKNIATLTLADGKTINLSEAKTGVAIDAGKLTYNDGTVINTGTVTNGSLDPKSLQLASISTPPGGTYQVILPDGTKVWLNATSSLKFPSTFAHSDKRRVELKGEGYFEVSKDKAHPFIVATEKQMVEVLGTHFNINAYSDEPLVKTTLLEGSVKVASGGIQKILKPGEQASVNSNTIQLKKVNTEEAIAWKDGLFMFEEEPLERIMRSVERWYNVKVIYGDVDRNYLYGGGVSRYDKVSTLLRKLEEAGEVHFEIEGRKIYVSKK